MAQHNDFGKAGEEQAQVFLRNNGYKILDCNWQFGKNELDIVAEKDNVLLICKRAEEQRIKQMVADAGAKFSGKFS